MRARRPGVALTRRPPPPPRGRDSEHCRAGEHTALHAEAREPLAVITKARARRLTRQMAHFLRHSYGVGAVEAEAGTGTGATDGHDEAKAVGDVVVVSTGQSALACLFFAVVAAAGVYSAASAAATPADVARQLRDGPARLLVCCRARRDLAVAAAGLPPSRVLVLESRPRVALRSADGAARCRFRRELPWVPIVDPRELRVRPVCILYSSGTTGLPKGAFVVASGPFPPLFFSSIASLSFSVSLAHPRTLLPLTRAFLLI